MTIRRTALALIAISLLAVCGGDSDSDDTGATPKTTSTTSASTRPSTDTTAPPSTTTTAPVDDAIVLEFAGGQVVGGIKRVAVTVGAEVTIRVTSDVAEELHVHTYNQKVNLAAGVPGSVSFKATIPGRHEVEFEKSGNQALELEVR